MAPDYPGIVSLRGVQRITKQELGALAPCTAELRG